MQCNAAEVPIFDREGTPVDLAMVLLVLSGARYRTPGLERHRFVAPSMTILFAGVLPEEMCGPP